MTMVGNGVFAENPVIGFVREVYKVDRYSVHHTERASLDNRSVNDLRLTSWAILNDVIMTPK